MLAIAMALFIIFSTMSFASASEIPNLNALDKNNFVNAVSNNANTDSNIALSKEDQAKLLVLFKDKLKNKTVDNSTELKLGAIGDEVKGLQIWLKENKFYWGNIDGNFGTDTEKAVKAFQKEIGLKEDGQVGEWTIKAIQQWDENAVTVSTPKTKASSSSKMKSSKKQVKSSKSNKKYYGWGYINGMDCWAMSDYLSSKYRGQGYKTRICHAKTRYSNDHRWVQVYKNGQWTNVHDYNNLPGIYNPT